MEDNAYRWRGKRASPLTFAEDMPNHYIADPLISEIYLKFLEKYGKIPPEKIKEGVLDSVEIDANSYEILIGAFHSFTKLAIEQIHRTYGPQKKSPDEAKELIRNCMFFLNEEAFEKFYMWADWCVAKGA